ncbi:MAG: homocysteine S-methyltransferase family protein, partial [Gammaproteobacteria bacterium]|nr:homocysteine S-methyltransferase family protein [Gammaproteobacteria bacterium]
ILMDGALGTELERRGVPFEGAGWSALALRDHGDIVRQTHEDYLRAGARLHIVNSFALARHVLEPLGLGGEFETLNRRAVALFDDAVAQSGVERDALWAAGSLSTFAANSDRTLLPRGDALTSNYRDQARVLLDAGVDLFALEMLFDKAVSLSMLEAVRGFGVPIILGFTCSWGQDRGARVTTAQGMGSPASPFDEVLPTVIDAIESEDVILSIMHSAADVIDEALEILRRYWDGPVAIYPNSGHFIDLRMQFDSVCSVAEFQQSARRWIDSGARIVGGCCGIGPAHIRGLNLESVS